jgi:hypothetical protein
MDPLDVDRQYDEVQEIRDELAALKDAVKRGIGTHIVDGGDIYDWGWMTCWEHNRQNEKLRKLLNFEDKAKWHELIQQARLL